jgi:hypothetical protein
LEIFLNFFGDLPPDGRKVPAARFYVVAYSTFLVLSHIGRPPPLLTR